MCQPQHYEPDVPETDTDVLKDRCTVQRRQVVHVVDIFAGSVARQDLSTTTKYEKYETDEPTAARERWKDGRGGEGRGQALMMSTNCQ